MTCSKFPEIHSTALFFDFDGTLVELADHPEAVRLDEITRSALSRLALAAGGALAIVSGRDVATIDHYLSPLKVPVAGVHGLVRRTHLDELVLPAINDLLFARLHGDLTDFARAHSGLIVERKMGSVALHFRGRPDLQSACTRFMTTLVSDEPSLSLRHGKMVIEARLKGADKGAAVQAFMAELPFAGRVPLFAGDDVTDEDAFMAVNAMGGLSIKIGEGETCAQQRIADVQTFRDWLKAFADCVEQGIEC